jgi:hypothetical protein
MLCDTSYFIRWAKPNEALHPAAQHYRKFLVEGGHTLYVATIALAEYAVRDAIANLPLRYFRVVPFNVDHAQQAGSFARAVFESRGALPAQITQRTIIPNDTKMFAHTDVTPEVTHYLTADSEREKVYQLLKVKEHPRFQFATFRPRGTKLLGNSTSPHSRATARSRTPHRGQRGATDGLGGRAGNTARRLPRHRRQFRPAPTSPPPGHTPAPAPT